MKTAKINTLENFPLYGNTVGGARLTLQYECLSSSLSLFMESLVFKVPYQHWNRLLNLNRDGRFRDNCKVHAVMLLYFIFSVTRQVHTASLIASWGDIFCPVEQQDGATGCITGWDGCITGHHDLSGCVTGWRPVVYRDSYMYQYLGWTSGPPVVQPVAPLHNGRPVT